MRDAERDRDATAIASAAPEHADRVRAAAGRGRRAPRRRAEPIASAKSGKPMLDERETRERVVEARESGLVDAGELQQRPRPRARDATRPSARERDARRSTAAPGRDRVAARSARARATPIANANERERRGGRERVERERVGARERERRERDARGEHRRSGMPSSQWRARARRKRSAHGAREGRSARVAPRASGVGTRGYLRPMPRRSRRRCSSRCPTSAIRTSGAPSCCSSITTRTAPSASC